MTDLDKLIAAVEAGTWPGGIDGAARGVFPYKSARADDLGLSAAEAFDGSLDAAHTLQKAVLPGWRVATIVEHPNFWEALIWERDRPSTSYAKSATPARAWLLAILRAMKEQETA